MFAILYDFIEYLIQRTKWRKKNPHNTTVMYRKKFDINRVIVGNGTYGPLFVFDEEGKSRLKIGNFCSIASNVVFITGSEHKLTNISTFPFRVKYLNETTPEAESKGDIIVDDDVWIGYSAIILSGVHIFQGAVIAAGAVVTKDVPPYAVVAGNPAIIIKYRFDDNERGEALKINYDHFDEKFIKNNISILYEEANIKTIRKLINNDTTISN